MEFEPDCRATGIGSVPHANIDSAWESVCGNFPEIPFWPQLPMFRKTEEMNFQYIESFPGLDAKRKKLIIDTSSERTAEEIEEFYRNAECENLDYFGITEKHSVALPTMRRALSNIHGIRGIKGQMLGPISLGLQATDQDLKSIIYNDIFRDVIVTDIRLKAKWMEERLREISKNTMIILDEPYLSFVGSAFCSLQKEEVGWLLNRCVGLLRGLKGIHCCSNADWGFLMSLNMDIISFDAYQFGEKLVLYSDELDMFLDRGGIIAWGLVPTSDEDIEKENSSTLTACFEKLLKLLERKGFERERILHRSMITPSCGLGSTNVDACERAHSMTRELSLSMRERYGLE